MYQSKDDGKKAIQQDRVIAGSADDFMEVRHLVLRGTNEEIGRALATIAIERYELEPVASVDHLRTRVQRQYFERHYPMLADRMRGVTVAFGNRFDDDAWNCSVLEYLLGPLPGCSVVHYPPSVTDGANGIVSRNFDFGTGTGSDMRPKPNELPITARPYLIEMHPDRGYASLALCAFDLLSGVLDGINSAGLTVTILVDDEFGPEGAFDPAEEGSVGLDECQTLRMLLDTCANVAQAKEALLLSKQYYRFMPSHFLIADKDGNAFVWEYSHAHNREYVIENPGRPLISTNFRLHEHMDGENPPSVAKARGVCSRYCALAESISAKQSRWTVDFIKKSHKTVDANSPAADFGLETPIRTLWHALYFPEQLKMQVSLYLGESPDPKQVTKPNIRRSDYLEFLLVSC